MNEMIVIALMVALSVIGKDHVACDSLYKRHYALTNDLLKVLPLYQGSEKLNKVLGHSLHSVSVKVRPIITLISSLCLILFTSLHIF
jgi:hypothetical protein